MKNYTQLKKDKLIKDLNDGQISTRQCYDKMAQIDQQQDAEWIPYQTPINLLTLTSTQEMDFDMGM